MAAMSREILFRMVGDASAFHIFLEIIRPVVQGMAGGRDQGWGKVTWISIPSSCPTPQPILPTFQLPMQGEAFRKINVNPT